MNTNTNHYPLLEVSIAAGLLVCMSSLKSFASDPTGGHFRVEDPVQLDFAWVPGGSFMLGDLAGTGQKDEQPLTSMRIKGFWMQTTEVTRAAYDSFVSDQQHDTGNSCWVHEDGWVEKAGLDWRNPGFEQDASHPATCVSWHDAQAFIVWLNQKSEHHFRLPTEAEWEYAARAGSDDIYFFGDRPLDLCDYANAADLSALKDYPGFSVNQCDDGFVRTSPVGNFKPNPIGLFDVYGNVWEWVEDCWVDNYRSHPADGTANQTGDCARRGFRGGGYGDIPHFARSTLRNRGNAEHRKDDIGFRLVMDSNPGSP